MVTDQPVWPPASPFSGRETEIARISAAAMEGRCQALVGMSNVGKSFLLRALCGRAGGIAGGSGSFFYVDCNRMVEFTEQGFYELTLRCIRAGLESSGVKESLAGTLEACYEDVVAPSSSLLAPLRFSEAVSAACEGLGRRLVLVLDAFDEVMQGMDDRVLLNLRALRDSYPDGLGYVTATRRRLSALRQSHGASEFAELFAQSTHFLAPLEAGAAAALIGQWVTADNLRLTPEDVPLLMHEAGGHPALLAAASHALGRLRQEAEAIHRPLSVAQIREQLDSDVACQAECAKFWQGLEQEERRATLQLGSEGAAVPPAIRQSLVERHLLRAGAAGLQPFCRLFASFLRRQRIARQRDMRGVRLDVEAGDVWVDGHRIAALTGLEYRLLLLLYGQLDKIVDKYAVVEAVWGQAYMDEVDDARIEKLVSRLRQKLEPNPSDPRYLVTVRGRGYRLVSP